MMPIMQRSDRISSRTHVWCMLRETIIYYTPRHPLSLSDLKAESRKRLSAIVAKILQDRRTGL